MRLRDQQAYEVEIGLTTGNDHDNARERAPDDAPSIGIILCAEKDDVEVEFALKTKGKPIGVAEYRLQARLPAEFKGRLPTANQLAGALRAALPLRK